jgi:glycosyltransferase involved in cell wall biosynthesis
METLDINVGTYGLTKGNGIDLTAYQQIVELARFGHNVDVYTFRRDLPDVEGVTIHHVPKYRPFYKTRELVKDQSYNKRDLFISYGSPFFMLAPHVDRHVMVEFGTPSPRLAASPREALAFSAIRLMTIKSSMQSSLVLPGSKYLYDGIKRYSNGHTFVSHSGIDFTGHARSKDVFDIGKPYILYVGRHTPYKNVHLLASILKDIKREVPDAALVTVGLVEKSYQKVFCRTLKNAKDVYTLGYVDDIWPLYRGATVYANCSLWEGEDRPALEAQSVGTPVVTFNNCSHPEVVHYGKTANSVIDFRRMLTEYLLYPEKSNHVQSFIRDEYSANTVVHRWLQRAKTVV